jgi:spermidine dehydrogenase
MARAISRRDFLNGVGVVIGASLAPACAKNEGPIAAAPAPHYPPAATGMRGAHPGSFEAAHAAVQGQRWQPDRIDEHYDLVVVGAGISGLSAAYIYRRDVDPNASILLLDNHDDFGGHAKRNEFTLDGHTYVGYGGTMMMEASITYPAVATQVISEIGIDVDRYSDSPHRKLLKSLGLGPVTFFDKETFGADFLAEDGLWFTEAMADAPLSPRAKAELARLTADEEDYLAGMTPAERRAIVESVSWRDYLEKYAGVGDEVLTFVQKWSHGVWAIGADALPAWMAWLEGYPGFAGMDIGYRDEGDEGDEAEQGGNFYFPDGNASIARLLVRKLVPGVAPGDSMADIVSARFDYSTLDAAENPTRIRLSSTVVDLRHRGGQLDADVEVTYVNEGKARAVTASKVVWTGYHAMLPHVCPDVPQEQAAAQGNSVRAPLVYLSVLIRNWRSMVKLGIQRAYCPGSFYHTVMISRQASLDDHEPSQSPDDPIVLHLQQIPLEPGLPAAEQFRTGRRSLFEMPFETFERNVREQLGRLLGPGGFDPARDIAGITVNRWPHGYAYSVDAKSGDVAWSPEHWRHEGRPWIDARQSIGNIAIAGTDASSNAMTESAIEEAYRAVQSLATADAV